MAGQNRPVRIPSIFDSEEDSDDTPSPMGFQPLVVNPKRGERKKPPPPVSKKAPSISSKPSSASEESNEASLSLKLSGTSSPNVEPGSVGREGSASGESIGSGEIPKAKDTVESVQESAAKNNSTGENGELKESGKGNSSDSDDNDLAATIYDAVRTVEGFCQSPEREESDNVEKDWNRKLLEENIEVKNKSEENKEENMNTDAKEENDSAKDIEEHGGVKDIRRKNSETDNLVASETIEGDVSLEDIEEKEDCTDKEMAVEDTDKEMAVEETDKEMAVADTDKEMAVAGTDKEMAVNEEQKETEESQEDANMEETPDTSLNIGENTVRTEDNHTQKTTNSSSKFIYRADDVKREKNEEPMDVDNYASATEKDKGSIDGDNDCDEEGELKIDVSEEDMQEVNNESTIETSPQIPKSKVATSGKVPVKVEDVFTDSDHDSQEEGTGSESGRLRVKSQELLFGGSETDSADPDDQRGSSSQQDSSRASSVEPSLAHTILTPGGSVLYKKVRGKDTNGHCKAPTRKPKTQNINMDALMKAFSQGWRREIVYRGIYDPNKSCNRSDIYYFAPNGKKLRSKNEIQDFLVKQGFSEELSLDNFCFVKEPLGIDEQYETIRNAGPARIRTSNQKGGSDTGTPSPSQTPQRATPTGTTTAKTVKVAKTATIPKTIVKRMLYPEAKKSSPKRPKPLPMPIQLYQRNYKKIPVLGGSPVIASKPPQVVVVDNGSGFTKTPPLYIPSTSQAALPISSTGGKVNFMSISGTNMRWVQQVSKPGPASRKQIVYTTKICDEIPPHAQRILTPLLSKDARQERTFHCTGYCPLAAGTVPCLQCMKCLCLFHPECTSTPPQAAHIIQAGGAKFLCPNCYKENKENSGSNNWVPPKAYEPLAQNPVMDDCMAEELEVSVEVQLDEEGEERGYTKVSLRPSSPPTPPDRPNIQPLASKLRTIRKVAVPEGDAVAQVRSPGSMGEPKFVLLRGIGTGGHPMAVQRGTTNVLPKGVILPSHAMGGQVVLSTTATIPTTTPVHNTNTPNVTATMDPLATMTPLHLATVPSMQSGTVGTFSAPEQSDSSSSTTSNELIVSSSNEPKNKKTLDTKLLALEQVDRGTPTRDVAAMFGVSRSTINAWKRKRNEICSPAIKVDEKRFVPDLCLRYRALQQVFKYLPVADLLAVSQVCVMWRDLAYSYSLWRIVRLRNVTVTNWDSFARFLERRNTREIDMRKMKLRIGHLVSRKSESAISSVPEDNGSRSPKSPSKSLPKEPDDRIPADEETGATNGKDHDDEPEPMDTDWKEKTHSDEEDTSSSRQADGRRSRRQSTRSNDSDSKTDKNLTVKVKKEANVSDDDDEDSKTESGSRIEVTSWRKIFKSLSSVHCLKGVVLPTCGGWLLQLLLSTCHNLTSILAVDLRSSVFTSAVFDPTYLMETPSMETLNISATNGFSLTTNFNFIKLPNLKVLVMRGLNGTWPYLGTSLTSLHLGPVGNTPSIWANIGNMANLEVLMLEDGGSENDAHVCSALSQLQNLQRLCLINFTLGAKLGATLNKLTKLKHLAILPVPTEETKDSVNLQTEHMLTLVYNLGDIQAMWAVRSQDLENDNIYVGQKKFKMRTGHTSSFTRDTCPRQVLVNVLKNSVMKAKLSIVRVDGNTVSHLMGVV